MCSVRSYNDAGIPLYKRIKIYEAFLVRAIDVLPVHDDVRQFQLDLNNLKVFDESTDDSNDQSDASHSDPFDPNDLNDLESRMLTTMERIEWRCRTVR